LSGLRDRVFRKRNIIHYLIFSSIWSSIKEEFEVIVDNAFWHLGNGKDINFWNDQFHITHQIGHSLSSTVSDYIHNGRWNLPPQLTLMFKNLSSIVHKVTIPL
jgi:hypothetical protein